MEAPEVARDGIEWRIVREPRDESVSRPLEPVLEHIERRGRIPQSNTVAAEVEGAEVDRRGSWLEPDDGHFRFEARNDDVRGSVQRPVEFDSDSIARTVSRTMWH
jgi:hypothetical protein